MLGSECWVRGVNVGLFVVGKGVMNLSMVFSGFCGVEGDAKVWIWVDMLDGIEGRIEVLRNGIVIVCWEEGNIWGQVGSRAHGDPVKASNKTLIPVIAYDLVCSR